MNRTEVIAIHVFQPFCLQIYRGEFTRLSIGVGHWNLFAECAIVFIIAALPNVHLIYANVNRKNKLHIG